jgi:hypothetical protein
MNQKQVIQSIKMLKEIKPRQEWVSLVKSQILNEKSAEQTALKPTQKTWSILEFLSSLNFQIRFAYAFATLAFLFVGILGFAQYTMPGDLLFPIKKIAEQSQSPLQVAYSRSEDLVQIVKENKTQNLVPAINEFKASIADVAKGLNQNLDKNSIKQVALEIKKIEDNQKQLQTFGINIGDTKESKDLDSALAVLVNSQILDLQKSTLSETQQASLKEIEDLYSQGKYSDALEKILSL